MKIQKRVKGIFKVYINRDLYITLNAPDFCYDCFCQCSAEPFRFLVNCQIHYWQFGWIFWLKYAIISMVFKNGRCGIFAANFLSAKISGQQDTHLPGAFPWLQMQAIRKASLLFRRIRLGITGRPCNIRCKWFVYRACSCGCAHCCLLFFYLAACGSRQLAYFAKCWSLLSLKYSYRALNILRHRI